MKNNKKLFSLAFANLFTQKKHKLATIALCGLVLFGGITPSYAGNSVNPEEEPGECSVIDLDNNNIQMGEPIAMEEQNTEHNSPQIKAEKPEQTK